MPPSQRPSHSQPSPLIDMDAPISLPPGSSSSRAAQPTPSARLASHRPSPRSISRIQEQRRTPLPLPRHHLDESDVDRFASLFMPATPPGTPTQPAPPIHEQVKAKICQHRRSHTESSSDSDFGPFVSVPPNQDPLGSAMPTVAATTATTTTRASESVVAGPTKMGNTSLDYFGQFTTSARAASERNRKGVLDELLAHQDDPMYFLGMQAQDGPLRSDRLTVMDLLDEDAELRAQTLSPPLLPSVSPASEPVSATPTPRPRSPVSPQPLQPAEMPASQFESNRGTCLRPRRISSPPYFLSYPSRTGIRIHVSTVFVPAPYPLHPCIRAYYAFIFSQQNSQYACNAQKAELEQHDWPPSHWHTTPAAPERNCHPRFLVLSY